MSYYIGATGEYIWEELLENTTSNVIISNNINFDAGPLTDAIQETITDALGTAVGELIAPITEVPSATGVGVVALTALGLLSYYKLNRTAVQDVDSMVYSADYASILTPGMFDDRVRIRYDNNWFSNSFYYEGGVKKGEILTYRPEQGSNILNLDATNIKLGTIENARLPLNYGTQLGIGTSPAVNTNLHIYNEDSPTIRLEAGANGTPGIEFQRGATNDVNVDFKIVNDTGRLKFLSQDEVDTYQTPASEIMRMTRTQLSIYENTEINGNLLLQSVAEGTPTVEFRRGTVSDANKDYRFISQGDIFKLQFQDTLTYFGDANNQLISINDTDTIIHKQTEFKANVLIGGDTRTIGYVGIGTTASTALHIYTAAANILRLQTAPVSGTNSIEFMRGNSTDPLTDYRLLTDTGGKFKIQYANNLLAYGATDTDLIDLSTTNTIIYKPTEFKGNVGIGTAPHATYKVDVNGTTQSTAFIGNGAGLTDLGADKISTGSLNLDRITLTTSKLYQNFNQINFAIIDDKIDLPAEYSINITAYDNPTLHSDIRYKGKMSVSYDDRRNIYKLVTSDTSKTDNVAVLKYKAGDRIHIRNIANTEEDFITTTLGATIYLKTVLYKRAFSLTFNKVTDGLSNFTQVFEWESRGFSGVPQVVDYRIQDGSTFPRYNFTKVMTFVVEAGYAYYLMRLWRDPTNGLYNEVALADDFDDYLRAFGAGQTFRLESGYNQLGIDYIPRTYTPPGLSVGSSQELGGVKPRRGMAIDASTGYLDAIPLSSDLITNMNTSHFTNNTGTNKIDISSTYVAPSATKLATARNIAGTAFDGTTNINITYGNLSSIPATWGESQIPSLPISKITNLQSTLDGKAPTSHSHAIADVTNLQSTLDGKAPTSHTHSIANITNLQSTLDGKAPTSHSHAIADVTNLQSTLDGKAPTSHTHAIADVTNLQSTLDGKAPTSHSHVIGDITNLQTALDAKQATLTAGTNITITGTTISSSTFTPTSANLIGSFNTTQFVNNTGTSKIDIDVNWKPTTCSIADSAMQLVSSRNIAGVAFNGTTSIAIPFANIDGLTAELATKQATINSTAGQLIIGNGNGATTTNAGLTWTTATNLLSATNLAVSGTSTLTGNISTNGIITIGAGGDISLPTTASSAIRWGTGVSTMFGRTITAGVYSTSALVGDAVLKAQNNLHIQSGDGAAAITIATTNNNVGIGITNPNASYKLDVVGDINITGAYRVNGALFSGSKWTTATDTTRIFYSNGNVGIGTNNPLSIFQVGTSGGRFKVSNGVSDFSTLGTNDVDGSANTKIVVSGNTRVGNIGNIEYYATSTGSHLFYTNGVTQQMQISNTGNVGIGTTSHGTYRVNVNGDVNVTGAFRIAGVALTGSGGLSQGMVVQMKHLTYTQMDVKNTTGWDAINDNLTTGFVIAITPTSTSSKILVNMIAHIGTNDNSTDSRWWGIKLYRKIGAGGAWTEITGANGTETGAAATTAGTPVWVSHNLGSVVSDVAYQYFIANLTGTYMDAPNTTSIVYYTAYWNQRLGDGINAISGNIYINRAHNHGDAFRPAPSSSWTATEIWDLGTPYVPPVGGDTTIQISGGNVGIGASPNVLYKLNVGGAINATSVLVDGNAIGSKWSLTPSTTNIFYNTGNVGIGVSTTSDVDDNTAFAIPTAVLYVKSPNTTGGTCDVVFRGGNAGQSGGKARLWLTSDAGHSSFIQSEHTGNGNTYLNFATANGNALPTERMRINNNGNVAIQSAGQGIGPVHMAAGSLCIGNTNQNYGNGNVWNSSTAGLLMECADVTEMAVHDSGNVVHSFMLYSGNTFFMGRDMGWGNATIYVRGNFQCDNQIYGSQFASGGNGGGFWKLDCPDTWIRLRDNSNNHRNLAVGEFYAHTDISGRFTSVNRTNTDYLVIQSESSGTGQGLHNVIRSAFGSFTAFHRCYSDDVLYDEENSDLFKNDYMGRVVIATGKIKTDLSRDKEPTEPEPESDIKKAPDIEWYSLINKDGITVEDAVPVVQFSRIKKDKRVFGVLGEPNRNTNNKNRLIVNSIGEGAICVANTNGNIENGDYLQSSDLLGYGEKQDDDLLHNYTIGKATIDCDFQLDSPYYQCKEIENGVRVAFIACSYHCG